MRAFGVLFSALVIAANLSPPALAQRAAPPAWVATASQEPQDSAMALISPDEYAWRLFVALNWPARGGARDADATKQLGQGGRVVWESWKLVSGGASKSEVYRTGGADPTPWEAPLDPYCDATARDLFALQNSGLGRVASPEFAPGVEQPGIDEVRMNFGAFDFISRNGLFTIDGQETQFASGKATISFPAPAKEVKAQWRLIADADESRYHACRSNGKLYGLTAVHILTKDMPNWFWATFEHIDNNKPENMSKPGYAPWLLPSRDAFSCPADRLDCGEFPRGIGLENTKWQNYRLRGSQIDFIDSRGTPTHLANSQVETDFQTSSSCITCHARASIGQRQGTASGANRLSIFDPPPTSSSQILTPFGPPNPAMFFDVAGGTALKTTKILKYTQLDFVWSLARAQRKVP
jgi:hypothetical protein